MKGSLTFVLMASLLCACSGNQAHRDCDRKLVPINGTMQTGSREGDSDQGQNANPYPYPYSNSDDVRSE